MPTVCCPYCKAWIFHKEHCDYEGLEHCLHCSENFRVKYYNNNIVYAEKRGIEIEIPEVLPKNVIDDFEEALACSRVEAYKATVVMCRRGLESLADDLTAEGKYLSEKLEDLKKQDVITKTTYHMVSGIRQFGNYGAHPQTDLLKDVDRSEAEIVLKTVERLLKEINEKGGLENRGDGE
ncbi:MAG: hypothetical protein EMLJLAPB_01197 [Candidatus Argoarchaeum ethanivorans]|uniref:DUF4145 domain-containing protein n=1 Tax=Candidatus Argoarchaeum ethanivorans TaxID=2608793 RepID=A0A811TCQ1_9EURY|nr:MAG: hypothetical protein EMLJLAPB_01197 [Candidatus Argoarchaeum ethanivorans]